MRWTNFFVSSPRALPKLRSLPSSSTNTWEDRLLLWLPWLLDGGATLLLLLLLLLGRASSS